MEFEYFTEEPASSSGKSQVQHYLYSKAENIMIQATKEGFCLRTEKWLLGYLQTMISGVVLPGFAHHGSVEVGDEVIRPLIDGLSYKAYMEERLTRINKVVAIHGERIRLAIPSISSKGAMGS